MLRRTMEVLMTVLAAPLALIFIPIQSVNDRVTRSRWPKTLDEAVELLLRDMNGDDLSLIRRAGSDVDWYSLGQGIRNDFGLWGRNEPLLISCGVAGNPHAANAASGVIIRELKRRLEAQENA